MSESKAIIVKRRSSSQGLVPLCALKPHDPSTDMRKPTKSSSAKGGPTERGRRMERSVESKKLERTEAP